MFLLFHTPVCNYACLEVEDAGILVGFYSVLEGFLCRPVAPPQRLQLLRCEHPFVLHFNEAAKSSYIIN